MSDGGKRTYTLGNLIDVAHREVVMRSRVYPGLVQKGKMRQAAADWEIGAMQAIESWLTERAAQIAAERLKASAG